MRSENIAFLIIGAAKSATTWLQRSLQADPGVQMPDPELHYFSREYHRGLAWYLSQFGETSPTVSIGEKSNSYLESPLAAKRIFSLLPSVRLIAQLRNPVERAYSDYCMLFRRGEVGADVNDWLDPRVAASARFVRNGLYYSQLRMYLDTFPTAQILTLFYDDIRAAPLVELNKARAFLGRSSASKEQLVEERVKDKSTAVLNPTLRRSLKMLKPLVRPLRGTRMFERIRNGIAHEVDYPSPSTEVVARLREYYSEDVERLAAFTHRDLSCWTAPRPQ